MNDEINLEDSKYDILRKPNPKVQYENMMMADTEYNRKKQAESMEAVKQKIISGVSQIEHEILTNTEKDTPYSLIHVMDLLEKVIKACGGESQLEFLDVGRTFIKAKTRVPVTAGLFPMIAEGEDNPRFHKVVTKILLLIPEVQGVRWVPTEDRGAYVILSFKEVDTRE